MSQRKLGIFDRDLAGRVFSSKLSDKVQAYNIHGNNPSLSTIVSEDVWDFGGDYTYISTATVLALSSDDAQDNPAGTGIGSVVVFGLDANYNLIKEVVTLNGITPVNTVLEFIRVYDVQANVPGITNPDAVFAGNLSVNSGGTLQAYILLGATATRMSMFTIPNAYSGFIDRAYSSGGPNDDFILGFHVRQFDNVFVTGENIEITNSAFASIIFNPSTGALPEKTDIKGRAIGISNNANCRISYSITLIKNDYLASLVESI